MAGLGPVSDYTSNYKFKLVNFDWISWGDFEHANWQVLDALLYTVIAVNNIQGVWDNSISVSVGDRYIDETDGTIWECNVGHTTATSPTTFSADRTANPTYWTQISPLTPVYKGAWAVDTVYTKNDFVSTDDHRYAVCSTSHTSSSAPATIDTDIANWDVLVDLGATVTAAEAAQTAAETAETNAETAETNAAASAAAASTSETNAGTSETNAAASAAAASTSETNAGTSETNAAASAAAASTSETNAATSETNAATSETNAATSETNAAASEAAALAAQQAAEDAFLNFTFDTAIDTAVDPGVGDVRFNHATPASVTEIAIDDQSANTGNPDVSGYINAFGDSSSAVKGFVRFMEIGAPQNVVIFSISAVSNEVGFTKLTVAHVDGAGTFDNGDTIGMLFTRTGDAGTVSGTVGTTDNRVPRADGTGGGTLQGSNVAIDDTGNVNPASDNTQSFGTTALGWLKAFLTGGLIFDERADHSETPAAGRGEIWTKNSTPNEPYFTDDAGNDIPLKAVGKQTLPIMAAAIFPATTNGCGAAAAVEKTAGQAEIIGCEFVHTADSHGLFNVPLPKGWNGGTVTFDAIWAAESGSGTIEFELSAVSFADNDPQDAAFGTAIAVTDTLLLADDIQITAESAALTIAGSPAAGSEFQQFKISRDVSAGTHAASAYLIGVRVYFNTNAPTDA